MSLTFVSFVATAAICYGIIRLIMWHFGRRRLYKMASKFEGPQALPVIGNAHLLVGNSEHLAVKFLELGDTHPSPFRVWFGPRLFIFITDPEEAKRILISPKALGKGEVAEFSRVVFGEGLFVAPVAKWQVHRKLIQPTFNPKVLDSFVEIFVAQSKIFTEQIEQNLNGPEFDIFNLVGSCTLDMICETAMGVKIGSQTNGNFLFVEALQEVVASCCKRFFNFWLQPDIVFYNLQIGKDQRKHIKFLHDFTADVVKIRRMEYLERDNQSNEVRDRNNESQEFIYSDDAVPRKKAFLDHLMEPIEGIAKLSDESLREEVNMMVLAGNDTSALTLTHTLLMLASHPEVQEKAYQEIWEIYGNDDVDVHPISPKDLPRMKYLDRVIKETMRLFPIAPLLVRAVTEDLDIGGHTIPSGSSAIVGILNIHRSEKYWPDPLTFDPDRFLPEEVAKRHPYAYLAFSAGPRNCVGFNYAMMSMKTFLATVLRRYILKKDKIVPVKDIRLKVEILLKMVDPETLRIERRTKD